MRQTAIITAAIALTFTLTSCFTGVESTKQIELSKQDIKASQPKPEDLYLADMEPVKASSWRPGKIFVPTDDRAALMFDQSSMPPNPLDMHIKGIPLTFKRISGRPDMAGNMEMILVFDHAGRELMYPTGITSANHRELTNLDLPMMVDLDVIDYLNHKLKGKNLWTRTSLWYDDEDNPMQGRKFVSVTVDSVTTGIRTYPTRIIFTDDTGKSRSIFLTFGKSEVDSRPFSSQFSLSDPQLDYPGIDKDVWMLIQQGKVRDGMTKNECRLSMGSPTEVIQGADHGYIYDLWQYGDGVYLMFRDGLLVKSSSYK